MPGEEQGKHIVGDPGREVICNCGGCDNGKRIQQQPRIIKLREKSRR